MHRKPLVLMILDGWGHREPGPDNAISLGHTPTWDRLWQEEPHSLLETSGAAVGLPDGQMGNSEVGHMNIGAGRIVYQDFTRISRAIEDGSFDDNAVLCEAIDAARDRGGTVHFLGLLSPGGVHSHDEHFHAAVALAAKRGQGPIRVHAFLDGRDTPPRSAGPSIEAMEARLANIDDAAVATVIGRYYAMDRDERWDRVERAWDAIVEGRADHHAATASDALTEAYARDEGDEFVAPTRIGDYAGMKDGDSVIFINFRADRARELTRAFVEPGFDGFERTAPRLAAFACMTEYLAGLPVSVAFPPETLPDLLGEVLAREGLRQLRIAETEKYAHVTFFMNGGQETPFEGEKRTLVPSPRVATYDLQPEMSAPELAKALDQAIRSGEHDVILCNVANPDMVGHTGSLEAATRAVEAVDRLLAVVCEALDATGGELLITADHGNVEQMTDPASGQVHTAHTTNPVPFVFRGRAIEGIESGSLRDLAPTVLALLGLPQPTAMTGHSLLRLAGDQRSVA
ncbi:MAG: 2,3-bisphosphoglycerate-independent phosphoglycerate mutase [Xanthomonadales bacterium]|jgi:2,3-bisphosphoglycerate-independent phosphoglycerate mutase|nr:2,3-bisphosphoglycerate-independent phosphoglycerate mutase [Xanthomonadales bacterium]